MAFISFQHHQLHPNGNGINLPFIAIKSSSNGSLSDSGISDGGCVSDGGLSEREKRLGALRRLARQLENALAPGSEALKSIARRMESAEIELRALQSTCRELIGRTTNGSSSSYNNKQGGEALQHQNAFLPPPSPIGSMSSDVEGGGMVGGGDSGGKSSVSSGKVKRSMQRLVLF